MTEADLHVAGFDLAPDGSAIAFAATTTRRRPTTASTSDLKLLDLDSKTIRDLVVRPGPDTDPWYSPDGKWIAFSSTGGVNDATANRPLYRVAAKGGEPEILTPDFDEHAGSNLRWARDGRSIYFTARQGVANRLVRVSMDSKQVEFVNSHDKDGELSAFALGDSGRFMVTAFSSPTKPDEIYRIDPGGAPKKLTAVNEAFEEWAPLTERFAYKAKDGSEQEALLLLPPESSDRPLPLLVVIHGGPAGVHGMRFSPSGGAWPYFSFVEQGYAVFRPNPRGSTGFGEAFRKAVVADWGGGRLWRHHAGRRPAHRKGGRRPRAHGRDGVELRRLHDRVDRDADGPLQSRICRAPALRMRSVCMERKTFRISSRRTLAA